MTEEKGHESHNSESEYEIIRKPSSAVRPRLTSFQEVDYVAPIDIVDLSPSTGVDFNPVLFPYDALHEKVKYEEYYRRVLPVDEYIDVLKNTTYQSKISRRSMISLAEDIFLSDNSALNNLVGPLQKEMGILKEFLKNETSVDNLITILDDIVKFNISYNVTIKGVQENVHELTSELNDKHGKSNMVDRRATHIRLKDIRSDDYHEEFNSSHIWNAVEEVNLTSQSLNQTNTSADVLTWEVKKINVFSKNTRRVLEHSIATSSLCISKVTKQSGYFGGSEIMLTPKTLIGIYPIESKPLQLDIEFFKSQERRLRNKSTYRVEFKTDHERERFYRLMKVNILSKKVSGERSSTYLPTPLKITSQTVSMKLRQQKVPEEDVAKSLHQAWILQRVEQGWSYGPTLDETLKTHPIMLPFVELLEEERKRNTQMVSDTLESIYVLGFEIAKEEGKHHSLEDPRNRISEELLQLVEFLAENAHDIWAHRKFMDGWKYGAERDNEKKLHPNLLPYFELEKADQELDRNAAYNILGAIIDLGYQIYKSNEY